MSRRVALITGAASGIGEAIARRFASEGITVALHSKQSVSEGLALADELGDASYTQADLSLDTEIRRLVSEVLNKHGQLDILVNNAGISQAIPHSDLKSATPEIWHQLYGVNVVAPWLLISEAEAELRASANRGQPGCIINISSHAGVRAKGASIPYAVSKAALNHMTRLLSLALAPEVGVNAIAPGLVDTPMTKAWASTHELWRNKAPMRRGAMPSEIADIAYMLAQSSYLTGEVIVADGGLNQT